MSNQVENLGINVQDGVKTLDRFGTQNAQKVIKGIAGTLHITNEGQKQKIVDIACQLSKSSRQPVVIVVKLT